MLSSTLPENQLWLLSRFEALDIAMDLKGLCQGYGLCAMQAYLADDMPRFLRRLELINSIPVNEFKSYCDELEKKRVKLIAEVKNKATGIFNQLNAKEMQAFEGQSHIVSEINKIKNFVMESEKTDLEKEQEFAKRKEDWIRNAYIQDKINIALNELPEDESITLEIPLFFESIARYHQTIDIEVYGKPGSKKEQIDLAISLLTPIKLEVSGGIVSIDSFTGIYNESAFELERYFDDASRVGRNFDTRFVLGLFSSNHFICLGCENFLQLRFQLIDANKPELAKNSFTRQHISKQVLSALSKSNITSFKTCIFTLKKDIEEILQFEKQWKSLSSWKSQHTVTPKKAKLTDSYGASWLHVASYAGEDKTVEELLSNESNPTLATFDSGNSPLHDACLGGNLNTIKILLNKINNPDIKNFDGITPLGLAAISGHPEIAKELIQKGAKPDTYNDILLSPILNKDLEMIKILLEAGANPNLDFTSYSRPLHIAAMMNDFDIIEHLLNHNADPNCLDANKETPLYLACFGGSLPIVKKLLDNGADPGLSKISILIPCCELGFDQIVSELLINQKMKPNVIYSGHSALYYAAQKGHYKVCELLLTNGADPNLSPTMPSPLFIAAQMGYMDIVKLLLEHPLTNAELPFISDIKSLREFAEKRNLSDAMDDFLKRKSDLNTDKISITPAEIAEIMGYSAIVNLIRNNLNTSTVAIEICRYIDEEVSFDKLSDDEKLAWDAFKKILNDSHDDNETIFDIFKKWKDIPGENGKTYLEILSPQIKNKSGIYSESKSAEVLNIILTNNHDKKANEVISTSNLRKKI